MQTRPAQQQPDYYSGKYGGDGPQEKGRQPLPGFIGIAAALHPTSLSDFMKGRVVTAARRASCPRERPLLFAHGENRLG